MLARTLVEVPRDAVQHVREKYHDHARCVAAAGNVAKRICQCVRDYSRRELHYIDNTECHWSITRAILTGVTTLMHHLPLEGIIVEHDKSQGPSYSRLRGSLTTRGCIIVRLS